MNLLEGLNGAQRQAVCHGDSPLLVLAGAGSGKTRVIVHRIVYLITEAGISPEKILSVTFTNKAAEEMARRVAILLGSKPDGMWLGTFHSICARILRREGKKIGLPPGFTIYDREDSLRLIKTLLKDMAPGKSPRDITRYLERISSLKSELVTPDDASRNGRADSALLGDLYASYQENLMKCEAVDFDDIIMKAVELFMVDSRTLKSYQERFFHILVDEYQDTNYAQYRLVSLLAGKGGNLFVVGDDDQSIYGWRGADLRNILEFEKDFPAAGSLVLDVNYRSTGNILDAASEMISYNEGRKPKVLRAYRERGEKVAIYRASDDRDEARKIFKTIQKAYVEDGFNFGDFAVLYRTNAQSRVIEEVLRKEGIPYKLVGTLSFYRRKEIKDLLGYLKVMVNPSDSLSLLRIINVPQRGIGEKTTRLLSEYADREGITLYHALGTIAGEDNLKGGRLDRLRSFKNLLEELIALSEKEDLPLVVREVLERTGYIQYLEESGTTESRGRIENIDEFVRAVEEYAMPYRLAGETACLLGFLEKTSLIEDVDNLPDSPSGVSLLTLHNAKGLEFPFVFIAGLEEGLLPWGRNGQENSDEVEEERRLFYVGMTRAESRLHLSHAYRRMNHGQLIRTLPSRFLGEIPGEMTTETASRQVRQFSGLFGHGEGRAVEHAAGNEDFPFDGSRESIVGKRIYHREFGGGEVIDSVGYGETLKLTIEFDTYGVKKIYPLYADLRPER